MLLGIGKLNLDAEGFANLPMLLLDSILFVVAPLHKHIRANALKSLGKIGDDYYFINTTKRAEKVCTDMTRRCRSAFALFSTDSLIVRYSNYQTVAEFARRF